MRQRNKAWKKFTGNETGKTKKRHRYFLKQALAKSYQPLKLIDRSKTYNYAIKEY